MKWLGQYIQSFTARFRDDVYLESLTTTTETSVLVVDSDGKVSKSTTLADDLESDVEASIDTLAGLTTIGATGVNTLISSDDVQMYNPVNDGNPTFSIGADANEQFMIQPVYDSGAQTLDYVEFKSFAASSTANKGKFIFTTDEAPRLTIDDGGIDLITGKGISINGTDILTDSSGTATLSNIDALDATTEATIESAIDTLSNLTTASSLVTVGTIGTGTWQGDAIESAYLDADTAHLSGKQTFTGTKIFDGDRNVTPGDGAIIHVDTHTVTDSNTSASGTAAMYTHVNIESPRLAATNASVTTTAAASLYISGAPTVGTNQTLTNAYALWVDDGDVQFDGRLTVDGAITGDLTGDASGSSGSCTGQAATVATISGLEASTVATIAGLAPNTATTQAIQPNIEQIGTDGDSLALLSDVLVMNNTTIQKPQIQLNNTSDDAYGGSIIMTTKRGAAGQDDDQLGLLGFNGFNDAGTPEIIAFGKIYSDIHDATDGEESGRLTFQVANHDGGLGSGLILTGGSADNEIDVSVGLGTASQTIIKGTVDVGGNNLNLAASASLTIDDTNIISDSSGTATLSNIDAVDATTRATINSAQRQLTHHMIKDNIGTGAPVYISLGEIDAESGTISNKNLPLLAPVAGKLLKIFVRSTTDMSGADLTFSLLTRSASLTTPGSAAVVGAQTGDGPDGSEMVTYDFTSSLDSGTNAIVAGDKVLISVISDTAVADSNYFITCLWEWDLS